MLTRSVSTASLVAKAAILRGILLISIASTAMSSCNDTGAPPSGQPALTQAEKASSGASNQFAQAAISPAAIAEMQQTGNASLDSVTPAGEPAAQQPPRDEFKVSRGKLYRIEGFALNKDAGTVPQTIRITLVGASAYELTTKTGIERGDVGDYFKNPAFTGAGFSIEAAFDKVQPGTYTVVIIEGEGAGTTSHPTHKTITVQ